MEKVLNTMSNPVSKKIIEFAALPRVCLTLKALITAAADIFIYFYFSEKIDTSCESSKIRLGR